jgi:ABC-type dipeptide/oligopeptide/nickel transport system permease subunit
MRFTDFALAFSRIFLLIFFAIVFMRPAFSDHLILTVLSINYIGDGLRDAFDPRKIL